MINSTSIDTFNNYILVNNTKELDIVDSNGTSKKSLATETNVMDLNGNYLFDKEFNSYVKNSELGLLFLDKDNICTVLIRLIIVLKILMVQLKSHFLIMLLLEVIKRILYIR